MRSVGTIVSQLDQCSKFTAFRGIILHREQSFLSPRTDLNFRHLSSCDTIAADGLAIFTSEEWLETFEERDTLGIRYHELGRTGTKWE